MPRSPPGLSGYTLIQLYKTLCRHRIIACPWSSNRGPSDQIRQAAVRQRIEQIIEAQNPYRSYHPLILPKHTPSELDKSTMTILEATFQALNNSNPSLAQNCWLCMTLGNPRPLALPSNQTISTAHTNCSSVIPFSTQPITLTSPFCIFANNSNPNAIDVGLFPLNCTNITTVSPIPVCPSNNSVFVCGNNLAYFALPANWTGLCAHALLLPDIDLLPGNQPVPLPALDLFPGRSKRAVTFLPLMAGLGVFTAIGAGATGVGLASHSHKLSLQLIDDIGALSDTVTDLQDQIDSLAEVVLQNRRGLDLLTAEQGGICLFLQEKCCFYANKSGIVRDKVRRLQEDLLQRKRQFMENPFLTGLHGLLPYLLPVLTPLLSLLLIISFGPWAFRKVTDFIKKQIDNILAKPIHVHYHRLAMTDAEGSDPPHVGPRYIDI